MRVGQHVVSLPSARKETVARVVRRSILFIQRAAATLEVSCVFWLLFGGGGAAGRRSGDAIVIGCVAVGGSCGGGGGGAIADELANRTVL